MTKYLILCLSLLLSSTSFAFDLFNVFNLGGNAAIASQYQQVMHQAKRQGLNPQVLSLALKAYDNTRAEGRVHKPILTVIDYSKPSSEARLWVIDLNRQTVLFHELVAHGKNSGDLMASHFSDHNGSLQSSLGVFVTEAPYVGKHGYSLHVQGLEKGFNSHARAREIVVHAAPYVSNQAVHRLGRLGRSWGCFALSQQIATKVINTIKGGSVIFAYYPHQAWLRHSKYLG